MRNALHHLLRKLGMDITPYPTPDWMWLRSHLLILFSVLQINCVIDVGAHFGEYATFLREIGYSEEIVSFEPIDENFRKISRRVQQDRRWHGYSYALGEENTVQDINVANCTDFSSFLTPNSYSAERFDAKGQVARTEQVEVRRLDSVLDKVVEHIADPRIYLKMDTQGWDLNVLKGATGVLDKVLALQSEISVHQLYEGMPDFLESMATMRRMGFEPVGFVPVSQDGLEAIEFDCLLVRHDVATEKVLRAAAGGIGSGEGRA